MATYKLVHAATGAPVGTNALLGTANGAKWHLVGVELPKADGTGGKLFMRPAGNRLAGIRVENKPARFGLRFELVKDATDLNELYAWIPSTPGGTLCTWLASATEDAAWAALIKDAAHMPYVDKAAFVKRGYTVNRCEGVSYKDLRGALL